MYLRVLFSPAGRRQFSSRFLLIAMLVHVLAALIAPLQQVFLLPKSIKRPNAELRDTRVPDLTDQFARLTSSEKFNSTVVIAARHHLEGATTFQPQEQLWLPGNFTCDTSENNVASDGRRPCSSPFTTFNNMQYLPEPFFASLPNGFNTGLVRQFIPRINSTATVSDAEFPTDCHAMPGALFFEYGPKRDGPASKDPWNVRVCLPMSVANGKGGGHKFPWKQIRARQDFSEELYLSFKDYRPANSNESGVQLKIVANTSAGYFELPNYMNNGVAGPLLDNAPSCGHDCADQFE